MSGPVGLISLPMLSVGCSAASSCRGRCAGRSGRSCAARPATQRSARSFLTVTGSVAPCPCCYPPITGLSVVASGGFPVRRSGRPRWLPILPPGRHRIGQYVHLQQRARLAALALRVGDTVRGPNTCRDTLRGQDPCVMPVSLIMSEAAVGRVRQPVQRGGPGGPRDRVADLAHRPGTRRSAVAARYRRVCGRADSRAPADGAKAERPARAGRRAAAPACAAGQG